MKNQSEPIQNKQTNKQQSQKKNPMPTMNIMNVNTSSNEAPTAVTLQIPEAAQVEGLAPEILSQIIGGTARRTETENTMDKLEQTACDYTMQLVEALPIYVFLGGVDLSKADIKVLRLLTSNKPIIHLQTYIQNHVTRKKDEFLSAENALNVATKIVRF